MASITKRGNSFAIVYMVDGKQKWESFKTEDEANARKLEIEYETMKGIFVAPSSTLVEDFLVQYVEVYGRTKWGHSSYNGNLSLIRNYINPNIGNWKLKDITTKKMDAFFTKLKTLKAVQQNGRGDPGLISDRTIYDINLLLSNAFDRAVEWGDIGKNPITRNACPDRKDKERDVWEPETAKYALSVCTDLNLLACMHLSIACSMRIGEITGLRWGFVTLGDEANDYAESSLQIDSQLQRISKQSFDNLQRKQECIRFVFPSLKEKGNTLLVLKSLKTDSSKRVVWIPPTTAAILRLLKQEQENLKAELGEEYRDYDMVIAHRNGRPVEGTYIDDKFALLIAENDLPDVDFHSLRHLSTTMKLIISKGDVKAVQGDTGHAQAKMVTDTYAHVLDKNRKKTAMKFEKAFYNDDDGDDEAPDAILEKLADYCAKNPDAMEKLKNIFTAQ